MTYCKNGTVVLHIATLFDGVVGGIRKRSSGIGKRQSWVGIHKVFWFFNNYISRKGAKALNLTFFRLRALRLCERILRIYLL